MMQGYIDNKEQRDKDFAAWQMVDADEGMDVSDPGAVTPDKAPDADDHDPRDRDPPSHPTKKTRTSRAANVAAAIEDAAPPAPPPVATLDVALQYGGIPCGEELKMKALIKATPNRSEKPKKAEVVLALDESMSMGHSSQAWSAAALLGNFCTDLFTNGVPDVELHLRVLMFGTEVVDQKIGGTNHPELVALNDKTRKDFLKIASHVDGRQGSTNIGEPVLRGIKILKAHREHMKGCIESGTATEEDLVPAQHVVVFTDGAANDGIRQGDQLFNSITEAIGESNIFVHFVGLGGSIMPSFITQAVDGGKAGVFASAPEAKDIATAYEEVFGFALETRMPLTVKIEDGKDEPRIEKLGMLIKERSALVDVWAPNNPTPGEHTWLKVTLMSNGEELNVSQTLSTEWHTGSEPINPTEEVKEALEREAVEAAMLEIQRTSATVDHAGELMRQATSKATSEGAYGPAALKRMNAMTRKTEGEAATYRSLGAQAAAVYSAKSATQSQYE